MVVRMRHTRAHTGNRRSHHALTEPRLSKCENCGAAHMRHRMCQNCGKYRGVVIQDIAAVMAKKEKKKSLAKKEREGAKA